MKKFAALLLALVLCMSALGAMADTYAGEATGFGGAIKLEAEVTDGAIVAINVLEANETETIGGMALNLLPEMVVSAQSTNIDGVSGATVTSTAFFEAVNAALTAAGLDPAALVPVEKSGENVETEELTCDVVIIGAGGAGMAASLKLNDQGYNVIVLEKQAFVGGATAMSGGSALASGSKYQALSGVEDSAEACFAYLMEYGDYENDGTPAWMLASKSGYAVDWLSDSMGIPFAEKMTGRARSAEGGGSGLAQNLYNKTQEKNIPVMLNTRAYELTDTDGHVDGVLARDVLTGKEYVVKAKAVLLATGGYCYAPELLGEEFQNPAYVLSGSKANTADGLYMAQKYGAVLQNMGHVTMSGAGINRGDKGQHTRRATSNIYKSYGAILVNQDGQRICNEADPSKDMVPAMRKQRNSYILMDKATFDFYAETCVSAGYFTQEQLDQWLAENGTGVTVFAHGETLEEVAAVVNVDAAGLVATVERYNGFVAAGEDTDFGHPVSLPIGEGPYYLVEQVLRFSTTMGGLTIDNNLQVVDSMNKPIDGLFAAGEVIGGVYGAHFPSSCGVGWAMTSGVLAGEFISAYLAE